MKLAITTRGLQLAVRAAVAAGLSVVIAQFLRLEYPIYALLAAVIVTDPNPSQTARLGLIRFVATIVGAICGASANMLLPSGPITIGGGILVAMLLCEVLNVRDGIRVAGYVCGIVVLNHSGDPWWYALLRFIETVLGIVVAWALSYVPKLLADKDAAPKS